MPLHRLGVFACAALTVRAMVEAGVVEGLVKTMQTNDFDGAVQESACALVAMISQDGTHVPGVNLLTSHLVAASDQPPACRRVLTPDGNTQLGLCGRSLTAASPRRL